MKLMVLDGNSLLNRAFYGIRPLTTADGLNTNAVYGFLTILRRLLAENRPDALCVAFDWASSAMPWRAGRRTICWAPLPQSARPVGRTACWSPGTGTACSSSALGPT